MEIIKKNSKEVVIAPDGELSINNSQELKKELLALFEEGFNIITLDFTNVDTIDSSGLGKLLLFQKILAEKNGELKIVNITSLYVKKMFELIKLHKLIDIKYNK